MVLLWIAVVSFRHCLCSLKDLKANESRLKDINKVAEDLESEGLMAEEVQAVQQQVGVWLLRGACLGAAWLPRSLCCSPARCPMVHSVARVQVLHVTCTILFTFDGREKQVSFLGPLSIMAVVESFFRP